MKISAWFSNRKPQAQLKQSTIKPFFAQPNLRTPFSFQSACFPLNRTFAARKRVNADGSPYQKLGKHRYQHKPDPNGPWVDKPDDFVMKKTIQLSALEKSNENSIPKITVEELNVLITTKEKEYMLIDLRDFTEGEPTIPSAISLPDPFATVPKDPQERKLPDENFFKTEMELSQDQFTKKYGFDKLSLEKNGETLIVFYSHTGKRSEAAVKTAIEMGFKNAKSLLGGSRLYNKIFNSSS